ncbi:hypothetical protein BS47DRAFT_1381245 [Hydnum rufescens UP504]|uniref:Uncharacterized protein n=1 Tax=Hydnum rufescens UP504 TaxID=1448309 RepID=A0A9P6B1T3_9AGAM|nr:hypothetical protein BS47DRAFT_1381245 [Hydnum rufescens UP504]
MVNFVKFPRISVEQYRGSPRDERVLSLRREGGGSNTVVAISVTHRDSFVSGVSLPLCQLVIWSPSCPHYFLLFSIPLSFLSLSFMERPARLRLSPHSFQLFATQTIDPRSRHSHDGEYDLERTSLLSSQTLVTFDPSFDEENDVHPSLSSADRPLDLLSLAKCLSILGGILVASILIVLLLIFLTNPESNTRDVDSINITTTVTSAFVIDYSAYSTFPLTPLQYAEECWKQIKEHPNNGAYWFEPAQGFSDAPHFQTHVRGVCNSSITYMLDGSTSGLVSELAILAQAAALARERGSAFFVSDKYWNRGKWSDYFEPIEAGQPGADPGCAPPPPEELVACPRLVRHWVITFRTAKFHLGEKFADEYEDSKARGIQRQRPIYDRSRSSFLHTIRPNARVRKLISAARADLLPDAMTHTSPNGSYISVHIRRGDMGSQSWEYRGLPVPIPEFLEAVDREEGRQRLETSQPIFNMGGYRQVDWDDNGIQQWSPVERVRYTSGMIVDLALLTGLWTDIASQIPSATICTIKSTICKMMAIGLGFDRAFDHDKGLQWIEIDAKGIIEPVWEAFTLSF